ncbi:hypothetical protein MJ579_10920 [Klebsiella pneumoniae]|nr:hypothetical protein MJ579_10920 [Klebsiella pneumoniae]
MADPVSAVEKLAQQEGRAGSAPHPENPAAARSHGSGRSNLPVSISANEHRLASLPLCPTARCINCGRHADVEQPVAEGEMQPVVNPAEPKDIVGYVREASDAEVQQALTSAINSRSGLPPAAGARRHS